MRSSVSAAAALHASLLISLQLCFVIGSVTRAKTLAPTDETPKMRKMTSTTATAIPPTTTETTNRTTPTTKSETKGVPAAEAAAEAEARVAVARAEWEADERVPRSVVVVVTGLGEAERRVLADSMSVVRRLHTCNEQVYPWWRLEEDSDGCYCHLALDDSLRVLARWAREAQGLPTGVVTALNPTDPISEPVVMTLSLPDDRLLHGRLKVSDAELLQRETDFIDELMGRRTTPKMRRHKHRDVDRLYKHFKGMARARVDHEDETRKIRSASRKGIKNRNREESEERRAANVSAILKRRVDKGKGKMDNEIPPAKETNRPEQLKAGKHSYEYKENCPLCKSNRSHELHTVLEAPATGNESHATREVLLVSGEHAHVASIESTTPAIDSARDDFDLGFYTQSGRPGGEQHHGGHTHGEQTHGEHTHGEYPHGEHHHGEHTHDDHTHGEYGKHIHGERPHGEHTHGEYPHGEHHHGEHTHDDHTHGEYGKHIHGEHRHGEHFHGENLHGDRGHGERGHGESGHGERAHGDHHSEHHGEHVHGQHPPHCREGVMHGGVCKHRAAAAKAAKAAGKAPAMDELYDLSGLRMSSKSLHSLMMRQWLRAVDPSLEALSSVRAAGRPLELLLRLATGLPRELTAYSEQPRPNLPLETQHVASADGRAAVLASALALLAKVEGAVPANGGLLVVRSVAPLGGGRLLPFLGRLGVQSMGTDLMRALATEAGIRAAWTLDADDNADAFSKMDDLPGDWSGDYAPGEFEGDSRLVVVVSACPGVLDSAVHLYADGPRSDRLRNVSSLEDLVKSLQNIMRETTKLNEMRGSGVEELSAVETPRGDGLQHVRLHVARVRVAPCAGRTCLQPVHHYCRNPTQENCVRPFKPFEATKAPRHHKRDARQPDRAWKYLLNMSRHRRPNLERQVFGGGGEYFRMEIIPRPDPVSRPRGNSTTANASEFKTENLKGGKEVLEVSSSEVSPLPTTSGPRSDDEDKKDEETRIIKEKLKESNDKLTTSKEGTVDVKIQEKSTMSDAITQNDILDETVNRKGRQVSFVDVKINNSLNDNQHEKHMGGTMAAKDNAELESAKVKRQLADAKRDISKEEGKKVNVKDSEMSDSAALNRSMLEASDAETVDEPITETTLDNYTGQNRPATNDDDRDPAASIVDANKEMDTHESRLPSHVTKTAQASCLVAVATTALSIVLLQ